MPPSLRLPVLDATSPSLAEAMRRCPLQAGLSHARGVRAFVLGNPKAWVGTAYHAVLAALPGVTGSATEREAAVLGLWDDAIAPLESRALAHPLDRRFGRAPTWPGYFLALATLKLRAGEGATRGEVWQAAGDSASGAVMLRERLLTGRGGRLTGQPDVVAGDEIIDYKTGSVREAPEEGGAANPTYVRQLHLYAVLVHENFGRWPRRGVLQPMTGETVRVELDPAACAAEADDAVARLADYNVRVGRGAALEELATPAPDACRWCAYKTLCPSFWRAATDAWRGALAGGAVEGTLIEPPQVLHGGVALGLRLEGVRGATGGATATIAPVSAQIHPAATTFVAAQRIRATGLRERPEGHFIATPRSLITAVDMLPSIEVPECSPS